MAVIAPCITVETADAYLESVQRLVPFAHRVHIDISDGEFAPSFLIGEDQLSWPQEWIVDVHAMVARPSEHIEKLIELKPHTIILHAEAQEDIVPILQKIKQADISAGVALLKTTVPAKVANALKEADHVMIFSGDLGHYGGEASMMQIEKIRLIKAINPRVEIGWDGGVSLDNAYTIASGGVDVLNAGGAIAKSDNPSDTFDKLTKESNKHGVI